MPKKTKQNNKYDTVLSRLTVILSRLYEGESLSVKVLAEEFGVCDKTIQRDFNERLKHLYPIKKVKRKWQMEEGFKLEKSRSFDEEIVLDILDKITEDIGGAFYTKAHKLLNKLKNGDYNPIYTKINLEDISDKFQELQILDNAIKEQKEVTCKYIRGDKEPYITTLQPMKIVNFEGFWYLLARNNDTVKKYYFKNITNVELLESSFTTTKELQEKLNNALTIWFNPQQEPFEVHLYTDAHAAKYFQRLPLPTQKIISHDSDGGMEFSIKITDEMEISSLIKYWIPHLFILEPASLKQRIANDLEEYKEKMELL